ncbi:MAG TPA: ABC transporter permease [Anaerolineales bacterium]|nr:ABC transporter permease [Anaerolineales bacterium]
MTAFATHFAFEFKTGLRSASSMLMNYLFPLGFYAMMGLVMTQVNPGFRETLIPAVILVALMAAALLGMPAPLVEAREAGIFRTYKINGVPAGSILLIPMLTTVFHALIAAGIISLTARPLFNGLNPQNWTALALVTLLAALNFGCLGALIAVVSNGSRATVLWSQLIFLPAMLLGGLMMPLNILPESVQGFSFLLPTTYAMQAYTGLAYRQATLIDPGLAVAILVIGAFLAIGLALFLFKWDSQATRRSRLAPLALLAWLPYLAGIFLR